MKFRQPFPALSILIATVIDRRTLFNPLYDEFLKQVRETGFQETEVLFEEDNKEISIGAKRQKLLNRAKGEYIVFFDSDDLPKSYYIKEILEAIRKNQGVHCIGFEIAMTSDGINPQLCCHSLKYKNWGSGVDGYDYVRNVTHFNPVRRELALSVGFKDVRYGEDKIYSDSVTSICKTEVFIPKVLFDYRYTTHQPFNEKYGIK